MPENSSTPSAPRSPAPPVSESGSGAIRSAVSRRGFFRGLVVRSLDQLEQAGQRLAEHLPDFIGKPRSAATQASGAASPGPPPSVRYLRPPGALPELAFLEACTRCGDCIRACPARCITTSGEQGPASFPHILPRLSPCVVCDELACMKVCPTGALRLVARAADIHMGRAVATHAACLRDRGEDCQLCVRQCPMGEPALGLDVLGQVEVRTGCIGCGVCERACPTEPPAIAITPRAD